MHSTFTSHPWVGEYGSGTSFTAPMVAGQAALLIDQNDNLKWWPETIKAVTMATAWHNIEDSSRLSEYDGAGRINTYNAYFATKIGRVAYDTLYESELPKSYSLYIYGGMKVRVVICWPSHPDTNVPPTTDYLRSDLDLVIYDPNGNYVTSSVSSTNNYEIVEFVASQSGYYTAEISQFEFDATYEYLGFAWDQVYQGWP